VAVDLLGRTPDFAPWLRTVVPVAAAVAIVASLALRLAPRGRAVLVAGAVAAALALAAGPASYSVATLGQSLSGGDVHAGPAGVSRGGPGGGGPGRSAGASGGFPGGPGGQPPAGAPTGPPPGAAAGGSASAGAPGAAGGGAADGGSARGGLGDGGSVSDELVAYLEANQGSAKYLVAAGGSMTTAPIIMETGKAVVTIGGFNGGDPAPTTAQLEQMVKDGELRYVLLSGTGGGGPGGGPGGTSEALVTWVQEHGTAVDGVETGGATLYRVSA